MGYCCLPTIWLARWLRNILIYLYHFVLRHRSYASVREAMDGRKDVKIEFLGLFDTVEAFGVPVEELRLALQQFRQVYNQTWIIERHGYRTPAQVRAAQLDRLPMAA